MSKVHDNHLVGYEVDGSIRRIVLRTENRDRGTPYGNTEVVFEGVEAYSFRNDCLENIVFDIEEAPLEAAVRAHKLDFEAGHRESGWPRFWGKDEVQTRERVAALVRDGVRWFELSSSYGMSGWVMARSMTLR
jgi:hypothetical protein